MTGTVSPEQVMEAIDESTILVSMMLVNNEVGSILPIEAAAKAKKKKISRIVSCRCCTGIWENGSLSEKSGIDLLTISG